jgi:hypothetical protein
MTLAKLIDDFLLFNQAKLLHAGAGFLSSTDHFLGFYPIGIDIIILPIQL